MPAKLSRRSQCVSLDNICFNRNGGPTELVKDRPRSRLPRSLGFSYRANCQSVRALPDMQGLIALHIGKLGLCFVEHRTEIARSTSISGARLTAHGARIHDRFLHAAGGDPREAEADLRRG